MKEPAQDGQYTEVCFNTNVPGNAENQEESCTPDDGSSSQKGESEISVHESNEANNESQPASLLGNSLTGLTRPLRIDPIGDALANLTRPLRIDPIGDALANLTRPLHIDPIGDALANLTRPLRIDPIGDALANLSRPPRIDPIGDVLANLSRPLRIDPIGDALANLGLGLSVHSAPRILKPTSVRKLIVPEIPDLTTSNQDITEQWPDTDHLDPADSISVEEKQYWLTQFDALVKDEGLRRFCRSLFASAHYSLAVQKACTYMHNTVREKSGRFDKDGADLMMAVFSPNKPLLRLNDLETISDKNEQQGYMFLLAGAMTGIRNPRSHEHDHEDSPEEALEMIVLVNHLMRMLDKSSSP